MKPKRACGLDIHKDTIFACVYMGNEKFERSEFGTLTPDIEELKKWLHQKSVCKVAMESTGIYWIPVWHVFLYKSYHYVVMHNVFVFEG
jgi:transposase